MKRLSLLRHAKSSWDDPNLEDYDRPLNERGWQAARRIGQEFRLRRFGFDLVLASPAVRVRETIVGLGEASFNAPVRFEPELYLADANQLLSAVCQLGDELSSVLLIGHNPGLQQLVLELSRGGDQQLRDQVKAKFPTAAMARIELPAERWSDIAAGSGRLVELILAKDLA